MKNYEYQVYLPDTFFEEISFDLCEILNLPIDFSIYDNSGGGIDKRIRGFYMIYDGRNRNNFVLCDFVTPDYVRYIVVRCEEDKHDAVRNCLEYWIRNTLCEYEYTYPTENEYIPKNMINEPDKALNELLGRTRLTLDILFEKRSIT